MPSGKQTKTPMGSFRPRNIPSRHELLIQSSTFFAIFLKSLQEEFQFQYTIESPEWIHFALLSELKFDPTDNLTRRHWYQNEAFLFLFNFYTRSIEYP